MATAGGVWWTAATMGSDADGPAIVASDVSTRITSTQPAMIGAFGAERTPSGDDQAGDAYLGIACVDQATGVHVTDVETGSPADRIGIMPGDQVLSIAGTPVAAMAAVKAVVGTLTPGRPVEIRILRGAVITVMTVTPGRTT